MNHDNRRITKREMRLLLTELFEHQALLLAGFVIREGVTERATRGLVNLLGASRRRSMRRLGEMSACSTGMKRRCGLAFSEILHRLHGDGGDVSRIEPIRIKRQYFRRGVS